MPTLSFMKASSQGQMKTTASADDKPRKSKSSNSSKRGKKARKQHAPNSSSSRKRREQEEENPPQQLPEELPQRRVLAAHIVEDSPAMTRRVLNKETLQQQQRQEQAEAAMNLPSGGGGNAPPAAGGRRWSTLPRRPSGFGEPGSGSGAAAAAAAAASSSALPEQDQQQALAIMMGANSSAAAAGGQYPQMGMGGMGMGSPMLGPAAAAAAGGNFQQDGLANHPAFAMGGGGHGQPVDMGGDDGAALDACIRDLSRRKAVMERAGAGAHADDFEAAATTAGAAAAQQLQQQQDSKRNGNNFDGGSEAGAGDGSDVEGLMRNIAEQEERLRALREQHRAMKDQFTGGGEQDAAGAGGGDAPPLQDGNPFDSADGAAPQQGRGHGAASDNNLDGSGHGNNANANAANNDRKGWFVCQTCHARAFSSREEAAAHECDCNGINAADQDQQQHSAATAAMMGRRPNGANSDSNFNATSSAFNAAQFGQYAQDAMYSMNQQQQQGGHQQHQHQQGTFDPSEQFAAQHQGHHHFGGAVGHHLQDAHQDVMLSGHHLQGHGQQGQGQGGNMMGGDDHNAALARRSFDRLAAAGSSSGPTSSADANASNSSSARPRQQNTAHSIAASLRNAGGMAKGSVLASDDGIGLMNTLDPTTGRPLYKILDEPLPLSMMSDKDWITPLHCFVRRHCVQLFTASPADVATPSKGKRRPIQVGQVGIRCPHCFNQQRRDEMIAEARARGEHVPEEELLNVVNNSSAAGNKSKSTTTATCRERGSVYYPTTLSSIYNATMNLLQRHLHACPAFPPEMMDRYRELKADDARSGTSKKYWIDSAHSLGLVDTTCGIRFSALTPPPLPGLQKEQVSAGIRSETRRNSVEFFSTRSNARRGSNFTTGAAGDPKLERRASQGGTPASARLKNPLVVAEDEKFSTGFSYHLLSQMQPCVFTEADRLGKRKGLPAGFAGIACRHCYGGYGAGRFFPSSIKTLSDTSKTLNVLYNHMNRCRKCPQEVRDHLTTLRASHDDERSRMKFGSQKAFFAKIWGRLHNGADSPQAPPSKRQKTARALVEQAQAEVAQAKATIQRDQQQVQAEQAHGANGVGRRIPWQSQQEQQQHQQQGGGHHQDQEHHQGQAQNQQGEDDRRRMVAHHQAQAQAMSQSQLMSSMGMHQGNSYAAMAHANGMGGGQQGMGGEGAMGGMGGHHGHFNPAAVAAMMGGGHGHHPGQGPMSMGGMGNMGMGGPMGGGGMGMGMGSMDPFAAASSYGGPQDGGFPSSMMGAGPNHRVGGMNNMSSQSTATKMGQDGKPQGLMGGHDQFVPPLPMDGLDSDTPPKDMHPRSA